MPSSLRSLFLGVREWHHALGMGMRNRHPATLKVFTNTAMKIIGLQGHLLNHYLDSMEIWNLLQSPGILAEACLGLAALYWVRRAVHDGMYMGWKLEEAGSWASDMSLLAVTVLRDLDQRIEKLVDERGLEDRLWWLFVGAMAERNVRLRADYCGHCDYHGTRFVKLAKELHLHEWSDIEEVLRRYLYLDRMWSKTKRWFTAAHPQANES